MISIQPNGNLTFQIFFYTVKEYFLMSREVVREKPPSNSHASDISCHGNILQYCTFISEKMYVISISDALHSILHRDGYEILVTRSHY